LRVLLISQEPSDGEERNQDDDDNPNIDAHQSRLLPPVRTRRETKKAPDVPGLLVRNIRRSLRDLSP